MLSKEEILSRRRDRYFNETIEQKNKRKEDSKRSYEKNKDSWKQKAKEKRQFGEDWYAVKKDYWKRNPKKYLLMQARKRAKEKGYEFSINETHFEIPEKCPIFNITLNEVSSSMSVRDFSPSLDRVDTDRGYIPGNVRVISFRANAKKSAMSLEDIERLYKYVKREL